MTGYCSNCHRVWTSEERQGICRWCRQPASCQTTTTKPCRLKSSRSRGPKQAHNGSDGYDRLPEPYLGYYRIALRFAHKALIDEREDLLHDIIIGLAKTGQMLATGGQQFTEIAQIRTAEHIKDHYWYQHYAYHNGLDCQHCSKAQRAKCRENWAYSDCHRAISLESMNQPITDGEGNITELAELIADDKAIDLAEWLDAKTFLIGAPVRLKTIAVKRNNGEELTGAERKYLTKLRKRYQQSFLEQGVTFRGKADISIVGAIA
jgi:hypothetical protein